MDYIYQLEFRPAAERKDIILNDIDLTIRTEIGPSIDVLDACDLFFRTRVMTGHKKVRAYDIDMVRNLADRCTKIKLLDPSRDGIDVTRVRKNLTIKTKTPGRRVFYVAPEGIVEIALIREDRNGDEESKIDRVTLPANVYNQSCDNSAIRTLFDQIADDYRDQYPGNTIFGDANTAPVWNQVVNIPDEFLAKYGVIIEPMDPAAVVTVGMDETLL